MTGNFFLSFLVLTMNVCLHASELAEEQEERQALLEISRRKGCLPASLFKDYYRQEFEDILGKELCGKNRWGEKRAFINDAMLSEGFHPMDIYYERIVKPQGVSAITEGTRFGERPLYALDEAITKNDQYTVILLSCAHTMFRREGRLKYSDYKTRRSRMVLNPHNEKLVQAAQKEGRSAIEEVTKLLTVADINSQCDCSGDTALMKAVSCGNNALVEFLLDKKADPAFVNADNETALSLLLKNEAEKDGIKQRLENLIHAGAPKTVKAFRDAVWLRSLRRRWCSKDIIDLLNPHRERAKRAHEIKSRSAILRVILEYCGTSFDATVKAQTDGALPAASIF